MPLSSAVKTLHFTSATLKCNGVQFFLWLLCGNYSWSWEVEKQSSVFNWMEFTFDINCLKCVKDLWMESRKDLIFTCRHTRETQYKLGCRSKKNWKRDPIKWKSAQYSRWQTPKQEIDAATHCQIWQSKRPRVLASRTATCSSLPAVVGIVDSAIGPTPPNSVVALMLVRLPWFPQIQDFRMGNWKSPNFEPGVF